VNKANKLSEVEAFRGLSPEELEKIAAITIIDRFRSGEVIFEDSYPGHDLYVIISGRVSVQMESITPHGVVSLTTIKPGEILGEFALIDSEPRSATALCTEETEVLIISGDRLRDLFERQNHIGFIVMRNLARIVCERIRRTNRILLNTMRNRSFQ